MLKLSMALSRNQYTEPIIRGEVRADGVIAEPVVVHPSEMFWRQLKFREFDVSEMSLASLFMLHAAGDRSWAALPVFTSRRFFHTGILVRRDADINGPRDLIGRLVGVPEYQQTAAVWSRGVLSSDFGVQPEDIKWVMDRQPEMSHGSATGFTPPPGLEFSYGPTDVTPAQMLAAGDLDALLIHLPGRNLIDRGSAGVEVREASRPLFTDRRVESTRFYRERGYVPANHCVVIKREVVDANPWVVLAVHQLFDRAREDADHAARRQAAEWADRGLISEGMLRQIRRSSDPYSLESSDMLRSLATYCHQQGLLPDAVDPDSVFEPQFRHMS